MKWSKLKLLLEGRFAKEIKGRVALYSAAYGNCTCGHAWITVDKKLVANFCTRAHFNRLLRNWRESGIYRLGPVPGDIPNRTKNYYLRQAVEYGDLSRQDFYRSCWDFIHKFSIDESLSSDNSLIQALAILDERVGKRRLRKLDREKLQPLARLFYDLRTR